jgi:hypothetical protein
MRNVLLLLAFVTNLPVFSQDSTGKRRLYAVGVDFLKNLQAWPMPHIEEKETKLMGELNLLTTTKKQFAFTSFTVGYAKINFRQDERYLYELAGFYVKIGQQFHTRRRLLFGYNASVSKTEVKQLFTIIGSLLSIFPI